jgi:metal-responsive CopG/Arc/MetJ family transcriptional regulator
MKTAVSIPDKVFRSADSLAKRLGVSRSRLYATALADFLARHQGLHVKERLDAIYGDEDSAPDPELVRLQVKSLSRGEW